MSQYEKEIYLLVTHVNECKQVKMTVKFSQVFWLSGLLSDSIFTSVEHPLAISSAY